MPVDSPKLAEVIRRVVEVAHPDRIILFGSWARGEADPDSGLDLLVVKSGVSHRRRLRYTRASSASPSPSTSSWSRPRTSQPSKKPQPAPWACPCRSAGSAPG
ncbi:MAG: nucleotidyltransferase domain-containing protein [Elusimicrobia bacterium]|nr:nucleotidyltransferase domain-containing protein [Elusimicrobiota bacterium]